jgi:hypothetical protein
MNIDFVVEYVHGRHTMRQYFARLVEESKIGAAYVDCGQLCARCLVHLWAAFVELDSIPRTEPVWANTNLRTTLTKVSEFYRDRVPIEDDDLPRCWRSFALALFCGNTDRFERAGEVLLRAGQLGVPDFVRAAPHVAELSGWETDRLAVDLLVRLGLVAEGREALTEILKEGSADRHDWARKVLGQLEERS